MVACCRPVDRGKPPAATTLGRLVARMITLNVHDAEGFRRLFNTGLLTSNCPSSCVSVVMQLLALGLTIVQPCTVELVEATDNNNGRLSGQYEEKNMSMLNCFINEGLFPTTSNRVPACLDAKLTLALIHESHPAVAEKQLRFSPEGTHTIREEISKICHAEVISPSRSSWAAECTGVRNKDRTMRICAH